MANRKKIKSIHDRIADKMYVKMINKITATEALRVAKEFGYDSDYRGDSDTELYVDGKKYFVSGA